MKLTVILAALSAVVSLTVSAAPDNAGAPKLPDGLVAHFSFDSVDEAGRTACSIDQEFTAQTSNTRWSQAWNKSGLMINGRNSLISLKDTPRLAITRFTISMHFKTYRVEEDNRVFLSKGLSGGYFLCVLGSNDEQGRNFGKLCFEIQGKRCVSDRPVNDNAWYNVTITVDDKIARMYIDGKKQQSEAILKKGFTLVSADLEIGNPEMKTEAKGRRKTRGFDGAVDELMIFNRAVTANEVADIFTCAVPRYPRKAVQWRINDLDELLERELITEEFHAARMKELMVEE